MTNEPREAGRREENKGTAEERRMVFEGKKEEEKHELVILLARVALRSFSGLHKVDDRDGPGRSWLHDSVAGHSRAPPRIPATMA